jgi:hypothetical protein
METIQKWPEKFSTIWKACSDREPNPNHIQTDFVVTVIEQMKELSK